MLTTALVLSIAPAYAQDFGMSIGGGMGMSITGEIGPMAPVGGGMGIVIVPGDFDGTESADTNPAPEKRTEEAMEAFCGDGGEVEIINKQPKQEKKSFWGGFVDYMTEGAKNREDSY